jgi:peptidoglycan/LPS O-acetylase OafA/YrhL
MKKFFTLDIPPNRVFGLDLLRTCAIFWVLFEHGNNFLPRKVQGRFVPLTFDGVSIFFVLSGYLIGTILIKTFSRQPLTPAGLLDFWLKRWFRTLPAYYLVLGFLTVMHGFVYHTFRPSDALPYLSFVQNFNRPMSSFFGESWSLAVEEWFYLLTPTLIAGLIIFLNISVKKSVALSTAIVIFTITAIRFYLYEANPPVSFREWDEGFRKLVITRLDATAYGVIASWVCYYYNAYWKLFRLPLFMIGCTGLLLTQLYYARYLLMYMGFSSVFFISATPIFTACILPYLSEWKTARGWLANLVVYTSIISYSLYLVNTTVIFELRERIRIEYVGYLTNPWVVQYALYWPLCFLLAIVLYKYYEHPMTQLRDRFTGSTPGASPSVQ